MVAAQVGVLSTVRHFNNFFYAQLFYFLTCTAVSAVAVMFFEECPFITAWSVIYVDFRWYLVGVVSAHKLRGPGS
jgi:hypothetical protein